MVVKIKADEIIYPIRMKRTDYEKVQALSHQQDLRAAQFVRRAIRQAIEREKQESGR